MHLDTAKPRHEEVGNNRDSKLPCRSNLLRRRASLSALSTRLKKKENGDEICAHLQMKSLLAFIQIQYLLSSGVRSFRQVITILSLAVAAVA